MRVCFYAAVLCVAAGCNATPAPLVIGHVAPLTGPDKETAEQAANGIRLAVEDYTAETASQKSARPIVVRHADDKGDPDATEGQAVRLAALNRALVLLGGTEVAEVVRLDRAGALLFSPIGQRAKSMSDLVVVTGLSPAQRGKALAQYLNDTVKPKDTILLVEPGEDTSATEAAFAAAWSELKHSAPARQEIGDPASDAVKKWIEDVPNDTLPIVIASPAVLKTLALETPLRERPLAYAGPEIARRPLKERTSPLYLVTAFAGDKAAEFAKRYEAKFQCPAEPHAALAYDDARMAIDVLKKGPQVPTKLRDDLNARKEFAGLTGTYKIADGVVERPAFAGRLDQGSFFDVR
jgi:branched-chain amino acid transport system substrate-binding protein